MQKRTSPVDPGNCFGKASSYMRVLRMVLATASAIGLLSLATQTRHVQAAANPPAHSPEAARPDGDTAPSAESLGVHFVPGSSSTIMIERDGKTYLVNLAEQTIQEKNSQVPASAGASAHLEPSHSSPQQVQAGAKIFAANCAKCHGAEGKGGGALKTPDFTSPSVQASFSEAYVIKTIHEGKPGTPMPAWQGKLSEADINSVAAFVRSLGAGKNSGGTAPRGAPPEIADVYTPADDYLFSMPTGRRLDRHGFYINFTHRFAFTPAFTGPGGGNTLMGLDDFAIASFGVRYGITDKLSVSAYRSSSILGRPIEFMGAYNLLDEHEHQPFNLVARVSIDGQDNFSKNFTTNFEMLVSRSITGRAQIYIAPTASIQNRELIQKPGQLNQTPPSLPGINTFSLGIGGAVDIRPTVALVAEVFPTLVNGEEMGIHRPAFAFGIQKRVYRHAFTLGFSTGPGTTVSQRAGTRATFLEMPSADTPAGLFIGFDLMRQVH